MDSILLVIIGVLTIAMSVYGGIVSAKTKKQRFAFGIMGALCCGFIIWQGFRLHDIQTRSMESQNNLKTLVENQGKEILNLKSEIADRENKIAKLTQEQLEFQQKQFYEPSVLVIYEDKKLQIINKGNSKILLWGIQFLDTREMLNKPRLVPTDSKFTINMAELKKDAVIESPSDPPSLPLEIYLKNDLGEKYTVKCLLNKRFYNNHPIIKTQMLSIEPSDW
jgi:hypothetical protein